MAFESLADSDDPCDIELSSLSAIYPEIEPDPADARAFSLELPVKPAQPVKVFFPAPTSATVPDIEPGQPPAQPRDNTNANAVGEPVREDSHELSYLPSVRLRISLPDSYPAELPPRVELSAVPSWIPTSRIEELVAECGKLWEELGRDSVVFAYIDYIQQLAENAFGVADEEGTLSVDLQHKIAILDYDISAKRAAFERETFDCGVCLDPKKGSACHRMLDCGHVFCSACLQDFYNNAIKEGDISSVRCLAPNCAREREALAAAAGVKKRKKPKLVSPSELLQIPLEHDVVKRYVTLKYKSELESDKNTIYCPRSWCNGAARSKRHRKPEGLEFSEDSDESGDEADGANAQASKTSGKAVAYNKTEDLLAICEDCGFAFCSRCYLSWHGEFFRCTARREKEELSAEEKASLEYMNLHTTPCPTCAAPAQKTQGCNHMICGRQGCETHFCYLCSAWLDPTNPYSHYNQQPGGRITGCFGRLWELEEGDGDDVDIRFAGGAAGRRPDLAAVDDFEPELDPALLIPEIEEVDDHGEPRDGAAAVAHQGPNRGHAPANNNNNNNNEDGVRRGVALEAPLVLRIDVDPPAPPAVPMPPPAEAAGGRQQNARGRGVGRAGRDGQNARRGRGNQGPNHQHRDPGPARNNAAVGRGRGGRARGAPFGAAAAAAAGRRAPEPDGDGDEDLAEAQLNEAQRAWVRQFVQMALNDQEDLVESDSDNEEEEMVFWIP